MPPRSHRMRIPAVEDVLEYVRHLGILRTLYRGGYVGVNKVLAMSIFDCLELRREDVNLALVDSARRYERRFLEPDELDRFAALLQSPYGQVAREAAARGDSCYAVLDGERLANLAFFAPRATPILDDLVLHFDPPSWYMHGAFTPAGYRGQRLHALGVLGGALELFEGGVPALVGVCERTNYRSEVSARRMGWKPCGTLSRVGLGPWTRLRRSSETEATGLRLELRGAEGSA